MTIDKIKIDPATLDVVGGKVTRFGNGSNAPATGNADGPAPHESKED